MPLRNTNGLHHQEKSSLGSRKQQTDKPVEESKEQMKKTIQKRMAQMIHHRTNNLDPARLRLSSSEPMIVHRQPTKCTWLTMVMAEPCHLNLWVFPSSKERDEAGTPCVTLGTVCVDGDGA